MGIMEKLLRAEQKIRRRIDGVFGDGASNTPLEVRREILEQVESRIVPDRGGKIFPFGGIAVRLRPPDQALRDVFQAALIQNRSLEDEIRQLLRDSGVTLHERFQVVVEFQQVDPAQPLFSIEFFRAEDLPEQPRPAAQLLVIKGIAQESAYPITKDRILIGRLAEVVDREGQMARRNDVVFLDNGDEVNSTVGRAHATIYFSRDKNEFRIIDEVSRYGTRIFREGRSIEVSGGNPRGIRLRAGDEIYLGRACLRFETD